MFAIALLSFLVVLINAHPPMHAEMHSAVVTLANEIDTNYLTSPAKIKIVAPLESALIPGGETYQLRCDIMSTPAATIHWKFNGKLIQGSNELNVEEKLLNFGKAIVDTGIVASILTIQCPSAENSGTYSCVGYNGHQTIETVAEVEIEGEASGCRSNHKSAPEIVFWTDSRFEMTGNVATLVCRANQQVDWVWMSNDELVKNNDKFTVLSNGDLVIKNIVWDDMGTYTCIARNQFGEARQETFLYPTAKKSSF
ncbi:Zwei Ig domain protein zig-4 [Caenorhabditis elegans]|uniref:Zwei Ig domain protein zig-4 n=1 Tax=Caenorhabditis elegans TaxID=6239 RepID=ZIG4_CAEEL|nr:Zwei Ig domain protein zig-4 [Caenorhabditis elegans]G5ECB1.1 RecName: Full=Zwei Ig domain protein zig-4; AltName: Full=2 Ig domain protein zig-4; Flags: Precursor [Caenorhabditis elegans]AAL59609.1 secreted 2-immunoglobulin-domain protein ZIG-4 [Caenorhabditis elegans]CCD63842.1 Zwei Ig domain protein zig-4 [Caenorhabditis elegans]|eukprot:NP_509335.1 Zwei Ig domain protein zig-4 [Caenorhabditis elegans]